MFWISILALAQNLFRMLRFVSHLSCHVLMFLHHEDNDITFLT